MTWVLIFWFAWLKPNFVPECSENNVLWIVEDIEDQEACYTALYRLKMEGIFNGACINKMRSPF